MTGPGVLVFCYLLVALADLRRPPAKRLHTSRSEPLRSHAWVVAACGLVVALALIAPVSASALDPTITIEASGTEIHVDWDGTTTPLGVWFVGCYVENSNDPGNANWDRLLTYTFLTPESLATPGSMDYSLGSSFFAPWRYVSVSAYEVGDDWTFVASEPWYVENPFYQPVSEGGVDMVAVAGAIVALLLVVAFLDHLIGWVRHGRG